MSATAYCSFCGKSQHDVRYLIAGTGKVFICDDDVRLCGEIIREREIETAARKIIKDELVELKKSTESIVERSNRGFLSWVLRKVGAA